MEWITAIAGSTSRESFDLVMVLIWCIWTERHAMLWYGKALEPSEMHCKVQTWLHEFHKWHGPRKNTNVVTGSHGSRQKMGGLKVIWRIEGIGSPLLAEIMAAREAVIFSQHQQTTHVEVEGDALMVTTALQHEDLRDSSPFGHIIADTRHILNGFS
ncbi:hypothetical protein D8674_011249 [Pyrus ussuriensis x Pyrus communis]|uniref:RNase H type-1 domain-containing protein n=1 Tax=Pyrus ussuriensis x Pyrus communis TaxID=2448454 RepID=A0A5N5G2R7_9ROSA|nr:hypothetical protein D8674_011249 [Pyrus ussuriensis x Pyrus communis]